MKVLLISVSWHAKYERNDLLLTGFQHSYIDNNRPISLIESI